MYVQLLISFYSPQMVATVNTTKYTTENDSTKKENKQTNKRYVFVLVFLAL